MRRRCDVGSEPVEGITNMPCGRIGTTELLLLGLLLVLLFGASRLPEIGRGLGLGIRRFKKSLREDEEDGRPKVEKKNPND